MDYDSITISMLNNQERSVTSNDKSKLIKFREERMDDAIVLCPILNNESAIISNADKNTIKRAWARYLKYRETSDLYIIQTIYSKLNPRSKSPFDYCYFPLWTLNRLIEVL